MVVHCGFVCGLYVVRQGWCSIHYGLTRSSQCRAKVAPWSSVVVKSASSAAAVGGAAAPESSLGAGGVAAAPAMAPAAATTGTSSGKRTLIPFHLRPAPPTTTSVARAAAPAPPTVTPAAGSDGSAAAAAADRASRSVFDELPGSGWHDPYGPRIHIFDIFFPFFIFFQPRQVLLFTFFPQKFLQKPKNQKPKNSQKIFCRF